MPPSSFLLIDFGATHVKSALWNPDDIAFGAIRIDSAPTAVSNVPRRCEIPLKAFHELFARICRDYENQNALLGIFVCSQMHGFAVLSDDDRPLTDYISWKDERSLDVVNDVSTFEPAVQMLGESYRRITGMKPRPGFPYFNLLHLLRERALPKSLQVITLPDWLAAVSGQARKVAHPTMLAGLGFWDLSAQKASDDLMKLCEPASRIRLYDAADENAVAGIWQGKNGSVPIYVGVGDHPCAVLGAECRPETSLSLNIATGSQASRISKTDADLKIEERPFFKGLRLHTITHIPAGRALEVFLRFPAEVAGALNNLRPFWDLLDRLTADEIDQATLEIDLAVFQSAWNYKDGGAIRRIADGRWTLKEYGAGLVRSMARQYVQAIALLDPGSEAREIVLSGGLARKLSALPTLFKRWTSRDVRPAAARDETLLGLQRIAQQTQQIGSHRL